MKKNKQVRKQVRKHIRNASVMGGLLTGCLAVTTLFCTNKPEKGTKQSDIPNGIGTWSIKADDKNIAMTVDSCIKGHLVYCTYNITKFNQDNIQMGTYNGMSGGNCTEDTILDDQEPCQIDQENIGFIDARASYYVFKEAKCYDASVNDKELELKGSIPKKIICK